MENLFVFDGIIDKNHVLECEKILLWEVFTEDFHMTIGHASLYYYLPFPNFALCYRDPIVDNMRMTLLIRSLNMNEEDAQACYFIASYY